MCGASVSIVALRNQTEPGDATRLCLLLPGRSNKVSVAIVNITGLDLRGEIGHGNAGVVGMRARYIGEHVLGAIPIGTVGDVKENTITMREHVPFAIHTDIHTDTIHTDKHVNL